MRRPHHEFLAEAALLPRRVEGRHGDEVHLLVLEASDAIGSLLAARALVATL